MATTSGTEPLSAAVPGRSAPASHVDWAAIFAGAVVASAIAFILTAFGSAVGLSLISPFEGEGIGSIGLLIAIGIWTVWVAASSFMAGGYLTGRMRGRTYDASEHESDIRDGTHGLIMWGVGVLLGAILLAGGAATTARVGAQAVGAAASAAGAAGSAAVAATGEEPDLRYLADTLLRPSGEQPSVMRSEPAPNPEISGEIGRIFENGTESGLAQDDRQYLQSVITDRTGLTAAEADQRIDQVVARYQTAKQQVQEAAEAARQMTVVAAFLLAASLLIGGAGAWYAAQMGGQHRDEQTVFALFGRRR